MSKGRFSRNWRVVARERRRWRSSSSTLAARLGLARSVKEERNTICTEDQVRESVIILLRRNEYVGTHQVGKMRPEHLHNVLGVLL
jgi:hypothetical protein